MADREVIINGIVLVHGQGVKESMETSTSTTVCFDETITEGATVSYKLDIDRVVFETKEQYTKLRDELMKMINVQGTITTREVIRYDQKKPFTIVKNFSGCILDGKEYEMKPEEHSAQNLSFICADMEEKTQ